MISCMVEWFNNCEQVVTIGIMIYIQIFLAIQSNDSTVYYH